MREILSTAVVVIKIRTDTFSTGPISSMHIRLVIAIRLGPFSSFPAFQHPDRANRLDSAIKLARMMINVATRNVFFSLNLAAAASTCITDVLKDRYIIFLRSPKCVWRVWSHCGVSRHSGQDGCQYI